jgi:hypothetical protein
MPAYFTGVSGGTDSLSQAYQRPADKVAAPPVDADPDTRHSATNGDSAPCQLPATNCAGVGWVGGGTWRNAIETEPGVGLIVPFTVTVNGTYSVDEE